MLKYVEQITSNGHRGPAWIARVRLSRSGRTIYFNGAALHRGRGIIGNHFDSLTREEYWVSGVKKRGTNRHWAGGGTIKIERSALAEFLRLTGKASLPRRGYELVDDMESVPNDRLHTWENRALQKTGTTLA